MILRGYNWTDLGLIIPPEPENENSSLHPKSYADRPHILYNEKTKKYVCWIKVMHTDGRQTQTVLVADALTGPYTKVRENLQPLGMNGGDFDLAQDVDGKAYYYFEKVHSMTVCAELSDDYTDVNGKYSTHFPHIGPPYVREATAHFLRNGKHYLVTSGTTGYFPNPSEVAVSDNWHGPFTVLGNPHRNDDSQTSFHSQISSVFKVRGKRDLYIAVADRWLPTKQDYVYEDYRRAFDRLFCKGIAMEQMPETEKKYLDGTIENTSIADYVWLPLVFENGKVFIDWHDEWRIEDYE